MQSYLKTIAAPLEHYRKVEAEAKGILELAADLKTSCDALKKSIEDAKPDFNKLLRDIAFGNAMRAAEFEARHMGPFNHSGKEIT